MHHQEVLKATRWGDRGVKKGQKGLVVSELVNEADERSINESEEVAAISKAEGNYHQHLTIEHVDKSAAEPSKGVLEKPFRISCMTQSNLLPPVA